MQRSVRLLLIAQLSLFFGLFICLLRTPQFLFESNEGGISNYGIYAKTFVPYTLGYGFCGIATILAAQTFPKLVVGRKSLYPILSTLGVLYLLVLISTYPYKLNPAFDHIHQFAGAALVSYMMGVGTWLAVFKSRNATSLLLFFTQAIGFLLILFTFFGVLHTLFIAELMESLAFGALLIVSVTGLLRVPATHALH